MATKEKKNTIQEYVVQKNKQKNKKKLSVLFFYERTGKNATNEYKHNYLTENMATNHHHREIATSPTIFSKPAPARPHRPRAARTAPQSRAGNGFFWLSRGCGCGCGAVRQISGQFCLKLV